MFVVESCGRWECTVHADLDVFHLKLISSRYFFSSFVENQPHSENNRKSILCVSCVEKQVISFRIFLFIFKWTHLLLFRAFNKIMPHYTFFLHHHHKARFSSSYTFIFISVWSSVSSAGAQLRRRHLCSPAPCRGKRRGRGWRCSPLCRNPPTSSSRCLKCAPEEKESRFTSVTVTKKWSNITLFRQNAFSRSKTDFNWDAQRQQQVAEVKCRHHLLQWRQNCLCSPSATRRDTYARSQCTGELKGEAVWEAECVREVVQCHFRWN